MSEFCFAPGLTGKEIAKALRSLSPRLADDAPVFASGGPHGAQPGGAVFASVSLLRLFGAHTLEDLSARVFGGRDPGSTRLAELAATLPLDAAPRFEKLRFFLGPATQSITFLCRRVRCEGAAPLFVAAAVDVSAAFGDGAVLASFLASFAPSPPLVAAEVTSPPLPQPRDAEEVRAALTQSLKETGPIRFLWRTDARDRFVEVTAPLARVVGAAAADLLGCDFGEVARGFQGDQGEPLAQILARRQSWSGVEIQWPIAGAAATVPVVLGAAPSFDQDRAFAGYRGFGLIDLERIAPARPDFGQNSSQPGGESDGMRPAAKPLDRPERMPVAGEATNIIALRPLAANQNAAAQRGDDPSTATLALTLDEQNAFHAIAFSLGAKLTDQEGQRGRAPGEESGFAPERANIGAAGAARPVGPPETSVVGTGAAGVVVDNRDMFQEIVDLLPIGILVCRDRAPVFANRFLLDLLGYADLGLATAAGALERIVNGMARRAVQGESVALRDGAGNPISLRADRQTIDWGRQNAELVTLRPVGGTSLEAERRRAESEARELNAILDTAMDGVAVLDLQGRIVTLNRSGEALFGYDQSEVAGEPFAMLIAPESRSRAQDYFEGLKSNGVVSLLNDGREIMGLARQGGAIPLFVTLGRISAGDPWDCGPEQEKEVRFCALLRDMTHWKKVERELDEARRAAERASALKSDFLAKVSHEIRTPLNAILGFAEVIMDERFGPIGNERYKDYLKDIHSSGALVMSLVNDLLDLSKIEAGKMELDFALVDANRIVSECVSIMQPLASRERVILRLSLAAGLPHVVADERSLRQIVLNLLSNAVKFNQPGGQVIVATALTESGHAVLRIRDTGVGMSEDEIEIAIEPFRQLATSRPSGGTGLGLPLTKALVEANRAFFSIKSKKHEGTLVEVAFPPARVLAK